MTEIKIEDIPAEELFKEEPIEKAPEVEPAQPQPKLDGITLAYYVAQMLAPSEHPDDVPANPREAFIESYTNVVGPLLDLIGFPEACEAFTGGKVLPPWLRIGVGTLIMVGGGVLLRRKYKNAGKGSVARRNRRGGEKLGTRKDVGARKDHAAGDTGPLAGPQPSPPPPEDEADDAKPL
jgi:hypothetical protein